MGFHRRLEDRKKNGVAGEKMVDETVEDSVDRVRVSLMENWKPHNSTVRSLL